VCSLNENATVTKTMNIDWCNEVLLYNVSIVHHPFDTDYTNMFRHNVNQDYWLEIKCFGDHCLSFIDLRLLSTPICSVVRYHNSILSLFMITTGLFTTVIWRVPLVDQIQLNCSEHIIVMNSHRVFAYFVLLNLWFCV